MRDLPDLSGLLVSAGDPVVPEIVNAPARYADVFRDHYAIEHRVEDFEHAAPLAPQAFGLFTWDGTKYVLAPGSHNIAGWTVHGPGDVTIALAVEARTSDEWFPVVAPQGVAGLVGAVLWWEYDDGARDESHCRIRLAAYLSGDDATDTHCSFLFHAYMRNRAVGVAGDGDSTPTATGDARGRVCVDGVESAEHRQALINYCASHRETWTDAGHDEEGRHRQPFYPLAAWQIEKAENDTDDGKILWQAGPLEELRWLANETGLKPLEIAWRVRGGLRWRGVMWSLRLASSAPPIWMRPAVTRPDGDHVSSGAWGEIGLLTAAAGSSGVTSEWGAIVSVGCVLTGL